jgi:hypothetical protein
MGDRAAGAAWALKDFDQWEAVPVQNLRAQKFKKKAAGG